MPFTLRPSTPDDAPRMVEIINAQVSEPTTVEDLLRGDERRPKDDPFIRLVAVSERGDIAGYGIAVSGHFEKPGHFMVRVRVDKPYRLQGVGDLLNTELERWAREHGAVHLYRMIRDDEPASLAWAEHRGYRIRHHMYESVLDLTGWNPAPFMAAVEDVQASGIRLTTMGTENQGEAGLRKYYDLSSQTAADMPNWEGRPFPEFDWWKERLKDDPYWKPEGIMIAADGDRWVALSQVVHQPSGRYYNGYTATHPEYRGRGLALAVKVKSIEYVRSKGAPAIRTNNHSANAPMLAVNRKLGYIPCPGIYEVGKDLSPES